MSEQFELPFSGFASSEVETAVVVEPPAIDLAFILGVKPGYLHQILASAMQRCRFLVLSNDSGNDAARIGPNLAKLFPDGSAPGWVAYRAGNDSVELRKLRDTLRARAAGSHSFDVSEPAKAMGDVIGCTDVRIIVIHYAEDLTRPDFAILARLLDEAAQRKLGLPLYCILGCRAPPSPKSMSV